jgi:hypothetical protein
MRNIFLTLLSGGALIVSLSCMNNQMNNQNIPVVYAQAGQP